MQLLKTVLIRPLRRRGRRKGWRFGERCKPQKPQKKKRTPGERREIDARIFGQRVTATKGSVGEYPGTEQ